MSTRNNDFSNRSQKVGGTEELVERPEFHQALARPQSPWSLEAGAGRRCERKREEEERGGENWATLHFQVDMKVAKRATVYQRGSN